MLHQIEGIILLSQNIPGLNHIFNFLFTELGLAFLKSFVIEKHLSI